MPPAWGFDRQAVEYAVFLHTVRSLLLAPSSVPHTRPTSYAMVGALYGAPRAAAATASAPRPLAPVPRSLRVCRRRSRACAAARDAAPTAPPTPPPAAQAATQPNGASAATAQAAAPLPLLKDFCVAVFSAQTYVKDYLEGPLRATVEPKNLRVREAALTSVCCRARRSAAQGRRFRRHGGTVEGGAHQRDGRPLPAVQPCTRGPTPVHGIRHCQSDARSLLGVSLPTWAHLPQKPLCLPPRRSIQMRQRHG